MRLILEYVEFLDQSWKKEVEDCIEFHVFEDFLNQYGLRILFGWGMWMPDLHGFHIMRMAMDLAEKAPDRAAGSKNCLQINIMNAEWGTDHGNDPVPSGFDGLEIRQDEDTMSEFFRMIEILSDEIGYYVDVIEIKFPEEIKKTHWQITFHVIFEEKKKK